MTTSHTARTETLGRLRDLSLHFSLACLALGIFAGAAAANTGRSIPPALASAARHSRRADRALVAKAERLKKCDSAHSGDPRACASARAEVQRAGSRLRAAERELARIARGTAESARTSSFGGDGALVAPRLTVSGQTLSWARVDNVNNYVFVRKVPGQVAQYSVITGTSVTPPPVPGTTVKYSIRTAVNGSAWAAEQAITYPHAGTGEPGETVDTQAAPRLSVSGQTLTWAAIGSISTYVLASKIPGEPEQFTEVTGTSVTPAAVAGQTVSYSVRTAVAGSAWSPEVAITYPTAPVAPLPPAVEPPPPPAPPVVGSMWVGVDAGGWPSSFASDIAGAVSYVRLDTPSSIAAWTAAGVKVIDDMSGPYNSGGVSAVNATEWAAKAVAEVKANPAIAAVEVLNEPGNQYIGWGSSAGSAANAAAYDKLLKTVHEAFVANFGSNYPPILASYDGGEGPTTWGEEMWAADPNVGSYINGITMHSYGGTSSRSASALGSRYHIEAAHAQHPNIPIYITEIGWPTAVGQPPTGDSLQWTEAEQAQNITNFVDWAKGTGYIADVTIFNYRDYGTSDWYGIESASGAHKLSYGALAAFK